MPKSPASQETDAALWFRLILPGGALGPGKIALLRAIVEKGSVSGAAKSLRMSHARSVKLVAEINALAADPIVDTRAGGLSGGGASLTPLGLAVLDAYAAIETTVATAATAPIAALAALLGASPERD
jgi:molybdate transport system regulatory protein